MLLGTVCAPATAQSDAQSVAGARPAQPAGGDAALVDSRPTWPASGTPYSVVRPDQCGSPVVVRCEPSTQPAPSPTGQRAQRLEERRRAPLDAIELDHIVIEADAIRPSLADVLSRAFAVRPSSGTTTVETGEGTQCTCMNRCPPFPFPCCDCSTPMNRYTAMPGASPLR